MKALPHNIDKSAFKREDYWGYGADGRGYAIKRAPYTGGWFIGPMRHFAPTLAAASQYLESLAGEQS